MRVMIFGVNWTLVSAFACGKSERKGLDDRQQYC